MLELVVNHSELFTRYNLGTLDWDQDDDKFKAENRPGHDSELGK